MKEYMAGIDLHGNNMFCGIVNRKGKRVLGIRLPCKLGDLLRELEPYDEAIDTIAVESTYNWYWLVDGLQESGYHTVLANPAGMQPYNGIKHADDKTDAFFLAELLRLGVLPIGYVYDPATRPVRDLLRRRLKLVQQRTSQLVSLKSQHTRMTGETLPLSKLKAMSPEETAKLYWHDCDRFISHAQRELAEHFDQTIAALEKEALRHVGQDEGFRRVTTIPGIGRILGLTIHLETGDPDRFAGAGAFASYCRCVQAKRFSNDKSKGQNNRKCGNKYLGWAFVEAAHFARRFDEECRRFFDRKVAKANFCVATKALACKLAKAGWHVMKHNTPYDPDRIFPGRRAQKE